MQNLEETSRSLNVYALFFFSSLEKPEGTELDFTMTADDCSGTLQSEFHLSMQGKGYLH